MYLLDERLSISLNSQIASRFMKTAENIDWSKPVEFRAWHDKQTDPPKTAFFIGQDGVEGVLAGNPERGDFRLCSGEIAQKIGVSRTTVYTELKRGQDGVTLDKNFRPAYDPDLAQKRVQEGLRRRGRKSDDIEKEEVENV